MPTVKSLKGDCCRTVIHTIRKGVWGQEGDIGQVPWSLILDSSLAAWTWTVNLLILLLQGSHYWHLELDILCCVGWPAPGRVLRCIPGCCLQDSNSPPFLTIRMSPALLGVGARITSPLRTPGLFFSHIHVFIKSTTVFKDLCVSGDTKKTRLVPALMELAF